MNLRKLLTFALFSSVISHSAFAAGNTIESFTVGTKPNAINIDVEKLASCGMEKLPGLQVWYFLGVKSGMGFCSNKVNYTAMMMKRDGVKEMTLGEDGDFISSNKQVELKSYVINDGGYKLKLSVKTPDKSEPVVKKYPFPFEVTSFEKRKPTVIQVVKKLYAKNEIDQFKIEDLTGTQWIISVKNTTYTMEKKPCIQFDITLDRQKQSVYVTADEVKSAKNGVVAEKTVNSKTWGPGPQKYKVTGSGKKTKISIWTKTAGNPVVREYDLP